MDGAALEAYVRRRIVEARELAGYTGREMARRMGVSPSAWSMTEVGTRAIDVVLVAKAAEVC